MKNLYTEVTQRIITALEQGTPPWVCPWQTGSAIPHNLATGKAYRGINFLMLTLEAGLNHYTDQRWLTFRQAQALGSTIRKGEYGTPIVFYHMRKLNEKPEAENEELGRSRLIPLLKAYTVFNISQLSSIPEHLILPLRQAWQPIAEARHLIEKSGALILHGGDRAFYRPSDDVIQLPATDSFLQAEDYYATALHELCHWTGHTERLHRLQEQAHGSKAYAFEELVAEIGAAFLCAHCGLSAQLQHASYINSWLDALRQDKRWIFVAAGAAQKAANFVVGLPETAGLEDAVEVAVDSVDSEAKAV